jgi:hypothetical protein
MGTQISNDVLNIIGKQSFPAPGSAEEKAMFNELQKGFRNQFELFFPDNLACKTIIVVPSLTLDQQVLAKVSGALYYEERLLCLLMLLRMPRTHIIYVSSMPIDPVIIDYYLHLLPGITGYHARERLTLLSCYDASPVSLTEKILCRDRLVQRIRNHIQQGHVTHLACFNTTAFERTLAVKLGVPVYGCDPSLNFLGTKSGSRDIFRKAEVLMPPGKENLHTKDEIISALVELKQQFPELNKAVVKLNDGFSGDGNAVLKFPSGVSVNQLSDCLKQSLHNVLYPVANDMDIGQFFEKFEEMGGIVEAFVEGNVKASPSVQCRINPFGEIDIISTHDQVLGGESRQVFIGAHFPASMAYRLEIAAVSRRISSVLKEEGVLGRFSIDFISVKEETGWKHYAIEINLRKGGTTHPYLMMQFLTNGRYEEENGFFVTPNNQHRYYFASDNLKEEQYKGLTPPDLIDIAMLHGLHFDGATQKGVMFHMIGALSQFGKMGIVCIGESPDEAFSFYRKTVEVLNKEAGNCL